MIKRWREVSIAERRAALYASPFHDFVVCWVENADDNGTVQGKALMPNAYDARIDLLGKLGAV